MSVKLRVAHVRSHALASVRLASAATLVICAVGLPGCTGRIGSVPGGGGPRGTNGGAGGGLVAGPDAGPGSVADIDPGRVGIHRLNNVEYDNTARDLLGTSLQPAA